MIRRQEVLTGANILSNWRSNILQVRDRKERSATMEERGHRGLIQGAKAYKATEIVRVLQQGLLELDGVVSEFGK